jgi:flagellar basal-body rod protein FlgC
MAENIFSSMDISGQGMSLQRMRLSAVANNIAHVNTTKGADGKPYQLEIVVVKSFQDNRFQQEFQSQLGLALSSDNQSEMQISGGSISPNAVFSAKTVKDESPPRLVFDPSHPDAREDGYVEMPNINIVTEMVEMMTAQRAFEANTQVTESAKNMARYSLEI